MKTSLLVLAALVLVPTTLFAKHQDIDSCLEAWGENPFGKSPRFRTLKTEVKIVGIGDQVTDSKKTSAPELVLVSPAVSVMTKQRFNLMNPNGWYCLKGPVTVMSKLEIHVHCQAHIASTNNGVAVAARSEHEGGVSVLGQVNVVREHCEESKAAAPAPVPSPTPAPAPTEAPKAK